MHVAVVTLFPEMLEAVTRWGVTSRAVKRGLIDVQCFNPREFAQDAYRTVDDRPYGGGPGMVMLVEPMIRAIAAAKHWVSARMGDGDSVSVVYLSPQGQRFTQAVAEATSRKAGVVLVAGRYEGLDERIIMLAVDEEWSVGDYVLSGGEIAAMAVVDAVARLLPGVLGHALSAVEDSFSEGLLDCPHYSRPEIYEGLAVPPVLLSGHHREIARWRRKQALGRTFERRPDLLQDRALDKQDKQLLAEYLGGQPD